MGLNRLRMAACGTFQTSPGRRIKKFASGLLVVMSLLAMAPEVRAGDARPVEEAKEKGPAYRVVDVSLVYMGNPRLFKKPCGVDSDRVYKSIPEYQEILAKNLTDRDVRYHFLMKKASDKFAKAIRSLAKDLEYDLVAGVGAVVPTAADVVAVANGTDGVIARLPA